MTGNTITFNDAPFISRGVILEGLLIPLADVNKCLEHFPVGDSQNIHKYCARHLDSRDYLYGRGGFAGGNDALTLGIANWNINTIRFNVLQVALDPCSPYYSPAYLQEIIDAVKFARAKGLVVILAIFDSPANDDSWFKDTYPKLALNDAVTLAAAKTLGNQFGNDQGVVLELLNEPYLAKTDLAVRWGIWRDGGSVNYGPFAGHQFVGVNTIIAELRKLGAKNAVIIQPPSATFEGFPGGIVDPMNLVIYSAHAFMVTGDDADVNWAFTFGELAKTVPFIMTAWGENSQDPWCTRDPDMAQKYLNYLQSIGAGVTGFAFDVGFTIVGDFTQTFDKPSKIDQSCGKGGGGQLLQKDFRGQLVMLANASPVISSVLQPSAVQAGVSGTFTVAATDADSPVADPLNYRITWGDGVTSPSVSSLQTSKSFTHAYAHAGTYSASVQVIDARGASVTQTFSVVVN